jgi:hypothetical protein
VKILAKVQEDVKLWHKLAKVDNFGISLAKCENLGIIGQNLINLV